MSTKPKSRRSADKKEPLAALRDPTQLRIVVTGLVLVVAYMGLYGPLSAEIDKGRAELDTELQRYRVISDIERLREQYKLFSDRLTTKSDMNEWVQYILGGVRQFPLQLSMLDPDKVRDLGPYKAVVLRATLEGSLADINKFLKWLETNERLIRVDALNIQPVRNKSDSLMATMTILGVMN
jgi:Tfp pilus assembly protein PilO